MDISEKKVITNIAYYTLAFFVVLFSVLFMVLINGRGLELYQMIIYNIWAVLVIIVVLTDLLVSMTGRGKLVVGFAVYGLALLFFIAGFIVYASLSVGGVIPAANADIFNVLIYFSLALTLGLIFVYTLGITKQRLNYEE